ncbi:Putative adhesin [Ruminococcaceae bacterium YRB3002]|nr:Putative adhesin [Ruminococcaceae bacterium YRB3002]
MSKVTKVILITAGSLILLGIILTVIGFAVLSNTAKKATSKVEYTHKEEVITEDIRNLNINEISENVEIRPSENGEIKVDYYDADNYMHQIETKGDTLEISVKTYSDDSPWWKRFSFHIDIDGIMTESKDHPTVIYLPEDSFGKLNITNISGDVKIPENYSFDDVTIETTSGDVWSYCVATGNTNIASVSGELDIRNIKASGLKVDTTSGNVTMNGCKVSDKIDIDTISGEVSLTDVESGHTKIETISGDIRLRTLVTDTADITTTSGDVTGTIAGVHEYDVDTTSGDVELPSSIKGEPLIKIDTVSGDVELDEAA